MLRIRQPNKSHQRVLLPLNNCFFSQVSLAEATDKTTDQPQYKCKFWVCFCFWQIQEQPKRIIFPSSCLLLYMEKSNYRVWATCENKGNSLSLSDDGNGENIILRTYSLSYPEEYWLFICTVRMFHENNFTQEGNRPEPRNQTLK